VPGSPLGYRMIGGFRRGTSLGQTADIATAVACPVESVAVLDAALPQDR
jgi:hypothetical protein